jgi:hypothetical protein
MSSAVRMLWLAVLVKVGLGASKLLVEEAMMIDEAKKVVVKDLSEKPEFARGSTGL